MPNRKAVHNHIGTVHAIAMCNLAELVGGVMTDATIDHKSHRWIPKGMTVQYLAKAETDLEAVAQIDYPRTWQDKEDLIVPVEVFNSSGEKSFTLILICISAPSRKSSYRAAIVCLSWRWP